MGLKNTIAGLDLFSGRQIWKFILFFFAMVIVAVSLVLSNNFVKSISSQERQRVELWANAVKQRSQLVVDAEKLFMSIQDGERKRIGQWGKAYEKIFEGGLEDKIDNFYLDFIEGNTTIPMLITDINSLEVIAIANVDSVFINQNTFDGELRELFSAYPPIVLPLRKFGGENQLLYYQDSYVFTDLRDLIAVIRDSFISEVVVNSANVPVMLVDSLFKHIIASGNVSISEDVDSLQLINSFKGKNQPLVIELPEYGECKVLYDNSVLLTQLKYYPLVTFIVIALFVVVAYFLFSTSRNAEQNLVWVGMSKETAHQLGTPISSLMGWMEVLKQNGVDESIIEEMARDVDRMENVTQRFSKIGSKPKLEPESISLVTLHALQYMKSRISSKVKIKTFFPENEILVPLNRNLYEWVIENLVKNAVDAMDGKGEINFSISEDSKLLNIDIRDTGKGVQSSKFKTIFKPGYTSKQRGWGLGLSLSKRIIEKYHGGKLFVKSSELNKGTTFRIILKKY
jgi:two-component system, sporulation sensor kinase D